MAELTLFHYRPGCSILHDVDGRIKLAAMLCFSLTTLTAGVSALVLISLFMACLLVQTRVSLWTVLIELRYFIMLMAIVFMARALATPGDAVIMKYHMSISIQGIVSGVMVCWRLMVIVILGLMWTATTRPAVIRQSIQWMLRPVPGVPHHKIGTMIGLLIRFIPVIFLKIREILDAQRARAVDQRKNPVYRMTKLSMSVLRNVFLTADRLAQAMEARCYGVHQTPIRWHAHFHDRVAMVVVLSLCGLMLIL